MEIRAKGLVSDETLESLRKKYHKSASVPLPKKQKSNEKNQQADECLDVSSEIIAEMKRWKKKDIIAKLKADGVTNYKESWRKDVLIDHYASAMRSPSEEETESMNCTDSQNRPVPPPSTFQTEPPPKQIPYGSVRRAIAQHEHAKPKEYQPVRKFVATTKTDIAIRNDPVADVSEPEPSQAPENHQNIPAIDQSTISENDDSRPKDVSTQKLEQEVILGTEKSAQGASVADVSKRATTQDLADDREAANEKQPLPKPVKITSNGGTGSLADDLEAANEKQPLPKPVKITNNGGTGSRVSLSPKRMPISPSIQPGLVSSAKKTYIENMTKRTPGKPMKPFPLTSPFGVGQLHSISKKGAASGSAALSGSMTGAQPKVTSETKENVSGECNDTAKKVHCAPNHQTKSQPPLKTKKIALAAQMRAKNKEKLPIPLYSASSSKSLLQGGASTRKLPSLNHSSASKRLKTKQITKSSNQTNTSSVNLLTVKKIPLPPTFESYDMSDTEDPGYDSDDSDAIAHMRANKQVPTWARSAQLKPAIKEQFTNRRIDPDELFGYVSTCDLTKMFNRCSPRYDRRRRGSGDWSPVKAIAAKVSSLHHNTEAGVC